VESDLYIQCKGLHSGRPLHKPIPNCIAVETAHPHAFAVAFAVYSAGLYLPRQRGTCQQFINLSDVHEVLGPALRALSPEQEDALRAIAAADDLQRNLDQRAQIARELRGRLSRSFIATL